MPLLRRLAVFFFLFALAIPTNGLNPRKLDEIIVNKCGDCPCNQPCPAPPPPSPPPVPKCPPPPIPPPPPPSPPPPSPPPPVCPPPPLPPPEKVCPPPPYDPVVPPSLPIPPSGESLYITGPPRDLYPIGAAGNRFTTGLQMLIGGVLFLGLFLTN